MSCVNSLICRSSKVDGGLSSLKCPFYSAGAQRFRRGVVSRPNVVSRNHLDLLKYGEQQMLLRSRPPRAPQWVNVR
jgi:hypothetical protein